MEQVPGYQLIISMIIERYGSANSYECRANCGHAAERWVFDYSDRDIYYAIVDGKARPYSNNLSAYVPLCDWHERKLYRLVKQYNELVVGS